MSQTSNSQQGRDDSGDATSYEELKKEMMQQIDQATDSIDSVDSPNEVTRVHSEPEATQEIAKSTMESSAEEESVEDYMNRLLQRSTSDKKNEASPVAPKKQASPPVASAEDSKKLLEDTFADELEARKKLLEPVKLTKATLPELEASFLNEMRSVSRQSADFAISDCEQRRYKSAASIQLGIGASLVGFGILQTMVAPTLTTTFVATPCYAVAIYFFWRYTQWRNLTKNVAKPKPVV